MELREQRTLLGGPWGQSQREVLGESPWMKEELRVEGEVRGSVIGMGTWRVLGREENLKKKRVW